jgi:cytochrome oxidase Cu insertion factor (SCO1/SenC/PrrC family)
MSAARAQRPPGTLAVVAFATILAITAAWWALALWPLGAEAPQWIVVTRDVCFGATHTGLPHAGGWLLLIGEPIGMLAVLMVVWGSNLRVGLQRLHQHLPGRLVSTAVVLAMTTGLVAAGTRVASATRSDPGEVFSLSAPLPPRTTVPAPALALHNQLGGVTDLASYRGRWVMVTFAFGHCDDICPIIVDHAKRARRDEGAEFVPLLVVTLDPWRDTPDRLPSIAQMWELGTDDRLLSGSVVEVNAALDRWKVARVRDENTGEVAHGSTIVLVDPDGRAAWRVEGAPQRVREALAIVVRERPSDSLSQSPTRIQGAY